jgi:aspartate aminotransferase
VKLRGPLGGLPLSPTMAVTAKAAALRALGRDIVSLAVGEPSFDTPAQVTAAMCEAAEAGETRYPPLAGLPALRAAVARRFSERYGASFASEQILVTQGGKQAIFAALKALVGVGDDVLVPTPWWVSYPGQLALVGGRAVPVPMTADEGRWHLRAEALERAHTPATRGLILNSPHNPTGWVMSRDEAEGIAAFVEAHDLWVVSDDVYVGLELGDGARMPSTLLAHVPSLASRVVIVDSVSKRYAMTGWRLGFLGGSPELIRQTSVWMSQTCSGLAPFLQRGALEALSLGDDIPTAWRSHYARGRDLVMATMDQLGWATARPEGAFYALCRLPPDLEDDQATALALLEEAGVATVPGSAFGEPGTLRLSFATASDELIEALSRLTRWAHTVDHSDRSPRPESSAERGKETDRAVLVARRTPLLGTGRSARRSRRSAGPTDQDG